CSQGTTLDEALRWAWQAFHGKSSRGRSCLLFWAAASQSRDAIPKKAKKAPPSNLRGSHLRRRVVRTSWTSSRDAYTGRTRTSTSFCMSILENGWCSRSRTSKSQQLVQIRLGSTQ